MGGKRKYEDKPERGSAETKSPLCILLLQEFAAGRMSAKQVQRIANAAIKSGAEAADLATVPRLCASGSSVGQVMLTRICAELFTRTCAHPSLLKFRCM